MKMEKQITKVRSGISRGLATQHPVKVVVGLALGVALLAGAALQIVPNYADEASRSLSGDQVERLPAGVTQVTADLYAEEPAASQSRAFFAESLPGNDDFYWPPILEKHYLSQTGR